MAYDIAKIFDLLNDALTNDDLHNLCLTHFEDVSGQFTTGQTKSQKLRLLLEFADRRRLLTNLLQLVKKINPAVYEEQEPYEKGQQPHEKDPARPAKTGIRILFLGSMPDDAVRLRLGKEYGEIERKVRGSEHRNLLQLKSAWAVRPGDLQEALLRETPHIVHFSGHGSSSDELMLEDDSGASQPVSRDALVRLLTILKDNLRVVVLNACYSAPQAEAITGVIDCAVGMKQAIGDEAAIQFAAAFYQGIGYGRSVETAFELGCSALELQGIPEEDTPRLLVRSGVDAGKIVLANP